MGGGGGSDEPTNLEKDYTKYYRRTILYMGCGIISGAALVITGGNVINRADSVKDNPLLKEYNIVISELAHLRHEYDDTTYSAFQFPTLTPESQKFLADRLVVLDNERKNGIENVIGMLEHDSAEICSSVEYQDITEDRYVAKKKYNRIGTVISIAGLLSYLGFSGVSFNNFLKKQKARAIINGKG